MEDFNLGQGLEDMRDPDLGQRAVGSDLVKESYGPTRLKGPGRGAWTAT